MDEAKPIEPLVNGINLPDRKNQFDILDFSSELGSDEKKIRNQVFAEKIYPMIKVFDHLPTHTPSNLNEQFAIYNGTLYAYINGTWTDLSSSATLQTKVGGIDALTDNTDKVLTVGFQAKLIRVTAINAGVNQMSWGAGTATASQKCIYTKEGDTSYFDGRVIMIYNGAGTDGRDARIKSISSTTFTLEVASAGTPPTVYFMWEAIG